MRVIFMVRRKGNLQGRFVNGYLRENPHRRSEYVKVSEYQEHVEPTPSKLTSVSPQGELEFSPPPAVGDGSSQVPADE